MLCFMAQQCSATDLEGDLGRLVKVYVEEASKHHEYLIAGKRKEKVKLDKVQKKRLEEIKKLVVEQGAVVSQQLLDLAKDTPDLQNALKAFPKLREKFLENQPFIDFSHGLDRIV